MRVLEQEKGGNKNQSRCTLLVSTKTEREALWRGTGEHEGRQSNGRKKKKCSTERFDLIVAAVAGCTC